MYSWSMDTRNRLMDATRELLWERGYAATSPKDILSRANAGQGSMYHHFAGKQELAVAALEESARSMRRDAQQVLDAGGSTREVLAAYLRRQRDVLKGCRMGRMTFDADVLNSPELLQPVTDTFVWLLNALAEIINHGIEQGEFPQELNARELAALVVSTVQGGYVLARATQDPVSFDAAVEGAIALLDKATEA